MTRPVAGAEGVRAAAAAAAEVPTDAEQLSMLPVRSSIGAPETVRAMVAERRRGRPPGAQNMATRDALKFVREILGDPLIERARDAMHTPESLAMELGCTKLEAFDRLDKIRADLARFFYAPLAPVNEKGEAVVPIFAMHAPGAQVAVVAGPGSKPWEGPWSGFAPADEETPQNQALPQPDDAVSHGAVSHETDKGLKE